MVKNENILLPSVTLAEIYGPKHVFNPRASFSRYGWMPKNQSVLNFITGSPLTIAGDMPVICNHAVTTEDGLSLIRLAKLNIAPCRYEYRTKQEYMETINLLVCKNQKLVLNSLHPPQEINSQGHWIDPQLLAFLNNKAHMEKFVPANFIPQRNVIPPSEISAIKPIKLPIVIKAATDKPTGGGRDVVICHHARDIKKAQRKFASSELVVIEEYLPIKKNYCVQFANTFAGDMIYLGTAAQINSSSGAYLGSWIEKDYSPPEEIVALGQKIMKNACALGYLGLAGFDIVLTEDNRIFAIDLNFRLNGSTAALLLSQSIFKHLHASVLLFSSWQTSLQFNRFRSVCEKAINKGDMVPLSIYNPELNPTSKAKTRLSAIFVGTSQQDIIKKRLPQFRDSL